MSDRVLRTPKRRCLRLDENSPPPPDVEDKRNCDAEMRREEVGERQMPKLKSYLEEEEEEEEREEKQGEDITGSPELCVSNPSFRPPSTPFEIPHIFNEILQYLPVKDLKSCRLVNKKWLETCVNRHHRKKMQLVIPSVRHQLGVMVRGWGKSNFLNFSVFGSVKLPQGIPLDNRNLRTFLTKYGHYIKCLVVPDGWKIKDLQDILFNYCIQLEELHLMGKVPHDTDRVIRAEDSAFLSRPVLWGLKKLVLEIVNAHTAHIPLASANSPTTVLNGENHRVRILINDLLTLTPNLEWVQCPSKMDLQRDPGFCTKLAALHGLTTEDVETSFNRTNQFLAQKLFSSTYFCNRKLIGLQLYLRLNSRGMEKLAAKDYPLHTIDLHVRTIDKQGFHDLLPQIGSTLKHLRLTVDNKFDIDYPCDFLTELETLDMVDYAGDLQFIGDIRKLKSLTLRYFNSHTFIKKPTPSFINANLSSLTLKSILLPNQQARCIKKFSVMFPKILKLNIDSVTDRDMLKIYDCLPKLEELYIQSNSVSNGGISGISESDTENILDEGYELHNYHEYENLRTLPYIGDLKDLKSLTLSGKINLLTSPFSTGRMMNTLQSLFILHGLLSLSKLRILTIHDATISAIEMKQLIRNLYLSKLEFVDCQIDQAVLVWVQKKLRTVALEFINRKSE